MEWERKHRNRPYFTGSIFFNKYAKVIQQRKGKSLKINGAGTTGYYVKKNVC